MWRVSPSGLINVEGLAQRPHQCGGFPPVPTVVLSRLVDAEAALLFIQAPGTMQGSKSRRIGATNPSTPPARCARSALSAHSYQVPLPNQAADARSPYVGVHAAPAFGIVAPAKQPCFSPVIHPAQTTSGASNALSCISTQYREAS